MGYLGVILDEEDHVECVSSKVSSRLLHLTRIRARLSLEASKQVNALLAQLVFDYADVACGVKSSKNDDSLKVNFKRHDLSSNLLSLAC